MLHFFMMDIGEYHADIQRNCKAISPDMPSQIRIPSNKKNLELIFKKLTLVLETPPIRSHNLGNTWEHQRTPWMPVDSKL